MGKLALVFLADGFEEVEAITPIDLLRRADITVQTVSISNSLEVKGAHDMVVKADVLFNDADFDNADVLILPGGSVGTRNLAQHADLKVKLVEFAEDDKMLAAICAAPSILGELGILRGRRATCYPGWDEALKGAYTSDHRVEVDENIITGRSAGTAMDFALALVAALASKAVAHKIAESILYSYYM